ncbi:MAG: UbiA family prenyltransferase [Kocuria sp.]|nr:UbiA family prenyltransferase [Kocuria sp.]
MNSIVKKPVSTFEAFWQLARPRTCLVSILAFTFGMEITGEAWGLRPGVGIAVTLLVPIVANLHNAYTDVAEDEANLPGRAALVRTAGLRRLRVAVRTGIGLIVVAGAYMGVSQLILAVSGSLLLIAYSAPPVRAKARPVLGLVIFSLVVAFPFIAGAIVTHSWWEWRTPWTVTTMGWFACLVIFFVAKGLVKNVPDFHGDTAAGLRTSATVMGTPRRAAQVAIIGTWIAYWLLPVAVYLTDAPRLMYLIVPWAVVAVWHVTRLVKSDLPSYLNGVLKWDMVVSVVTLSILALTPRTSPVAIATVSGCVLILVAADLIGRDSRAPEHLNQAEPRSESGESHA